MPTLSHIFTTVVALWHNDDSENGFGLRFGSNTEPTVRDVETTIVAALPRLRRMQSARITTLAVDQLQRFARQGRLMSAVPVDLPHFSVPGVGIVLADTDRGYPWMLGKAADWRHNNLRKAIKTAGRSLPDALLANGAET